MMQQRVSLKSVRFCSRAACAGAASGVVAFAAAGQTEINAENLRDVHVVTAINAIAEELYARKAPERFWEPADYGGAVPAGQAGGYTALVTLALLYAGETYQSERLADAIAYLEEIELGGTYAVGVRANVWALLPPRFEPYLERDTTWLLEGFSDRVGGWNYQQEPNTTRKDNSIRQYGALGLWEAAKRGVRIEDRYWQSLEQNIMQLQLADGGWNYQGDGPATGSMTTAGLMILFITQDYLHADDALTPGRGHNSPNQAAIDRGITWMNENFSAVTNPGRDTDFYYYLYGVERVGLAGGYKYFGGHDWYREGAVELIRRMCAWHPETRTMTVHRTLEGNARAGELKTVDLAFALMFLSRGRVPVAANKLSDSGLTWNNRPRDVANLTRLLSGSSEQGFAWQVVNAAAEPEEWLDAPMLYLASHEAPTWAPRDRGEIDRLAVEHSDFLRQRAAGETAHEAEPEFLFIEMRKMRKYLDLGGLLVANAEGRSATFSDSIEALGRILYPDHEWRDLEPNHSAYTQYLAVDEGRPALRGLSNGVRELIILSRDTDFSEAMQVLTGDELEGPGATLLNIALYASELNHSRARVALHTLDRDALRTASVPARIVHASYDGAWNAEPLALDVFSAWAWNERGLDIEIVDAPLESIDAIQPQPELVIVSGVGVHQFNEHERGAIERFVEDGGVILFETTGGTGEFATSAEESLHELFGQSARAMLRHPVVSGEGIGGAERIARVEYRPFAFEVFGGRETAVRMRGLTFGENEEARVLFSREDISHGLLDQPRWGISGYAPEWSRRLLANVIHYARSRESTVGQ